MFGDYVEGEPRWWKYAFLNRGRPWEQYLSNRFAELERFGPHTEPGRRKDARGPSEERAGRARGTEHLGDRRRHLTDQAQTSLPLAGAASLGSPYSRGTFEQQG